MNGLFVDSQGVLRSSKASEPEKIAYKKGLLASEKTMLNRKTAALDHINSVANSSNSILNNLRMISPRKSQRKNVCHIDPTVISKGICATDPVHRSPRQQSKVATSITKSGSKSASRTKKTPKPVSSSGSIAGDLMRLGKKL